jgi:hypothetical protein
MRQYATVTKGVQKKLFGLHLEYKKDVLIRTLGKWQQQPEMIE